MAAKEEAVPGGAGVVTARARGRRGRGVGVQPDRAAGDGNAQNCDVAELGQDEAGQGAADLCGGLAIGQSGDPARTAAPPAQPGVRQSSPGLTAHPDYIGVSGVRLTWRDGQYVPA